MMISKRFIRAGSETNSPSPAVRTTRRTRASSVDPESLDQNKSQSNTPIKIRRRASVLPANSPVKEEIEDNRIPYVRLDVTIFETEENSGNCIKLYLHILKIYRYNGFSTISYLKYIYYN